MYPERLDSRPADPFAPSCYFDVDYLAVRSELPPYTMQANIGYADGIRNDNSGRGGNGVYGGMTFVFLH